SVTGVVGDVVGGVVGGIGGSAANEMSGGGPAQIGNSTGLNLNFGQQIADRNQNTVANQMQLDQYLANAISGQGPTIAQAQLQAATDQNIAQQQAMAASARGANVGLAQRGAMMNAATAQQQAANQSAILRAQEMQQAQINMMNNIANKDAFSTSLINTGTARDTGQANLDEASKKRYQDSAGSVMGGIGAGIGVAAQSDKNSKKNIKDGSSEIDRFLRAISGKSYEYKDSKKDDHLGGRGRYVSPMAQDLEKTKTGKSMVKDSPGGKIVDYGKGFGALLASQARIAERLDEIEEKMNA